MALFSNLRPLFLAALLGFGGVGQAYGAPTTTPTRTAAEDSEATSFDVLERSLQLLEQHYLLPEKLEPQDLFRSSLTYLAAKTSDGLFIPGQEGEPDALLIGYRTILVDGAAIKDMDDLSDALVSVASFYRQATVFTEIEDDVAIERLLTQGMLKGLDSPTRLLVESGLENFQVRSRGSLIGVGMVINIRDGRPWVKEVVARGPSERGGVQVGDTILRIDGESTQDMPLKEVVSRLRGEVGTAVSLQIQRPGEEPALYLDLTRAKVRVENVKVARLPGGVVYLSISNFSDRTLTNFRAQLRSILQSGDDIEGFILDLRANRGGSLKQSAFVADQFVDDGRLVRTTGRDNKKVRGLIEKIESRPEMLIPEDVPVAVLVGPRTASGAEILAGSLKYLDRAVIIGRGTFGKGTVQKVYSINDEASLKATVARYLLEGDQWLHGVGMQPDIEVTRATIRDGHVAINDQREIRRFVAQQQEEVDDFRGEGEGRANFRIQYVKVENEVDAGEKAPALPRSLEERLAEDYEVTLAADILKKSGKNTRTATLRRLSRVVEAANAEQLAVMGGALAEMGVDWSPSDMAKSTDATLAEGENPLSLTLSGEGGVKRLTPDDEKIPLNLKAMLSGDETWHRVRVTTLSADRAFDGHDFILGKIEPGQPIASQLPIRLPRRIEAGVREVRLVVTADNLEKPIEVLQYIDVAPVKRPAYAVHVRYHDDAAHGGRGDGDGILEVGEQIAVHIQVRNTSEIPTDEVRIALKNPLRKDIEVLESSHLVESIPGHGEASARLTFEVKGVDDQASYPPIEVKLSVRDRLNGFTLNHGLKFETAEDETIAQAPVDWYEDGQYLLAPQVSLNDLGLRGPIEDETLTVRATAIDDATLKVLSLYLDGEKVGRVLGPEGGENSALKLEQEIHLEPGAHIIELVATDHDGLKTHHRYRTAVQGDTVATAEAAHGE